MGWTGRARLPTEDHGRPPAPMRTTERHHGRLVEFFVHTEDSLVAFPDRERQLRRSPLLHMVAFGSIATDPDGRIARLQDLARQRWDAVRHVDPGLCERLLSGLRHAVHGDPGDLLTTGRAELDRLGGPLDEGYERRA